jgi:ubiquinone/menaquinone biosynthesis C-methylase UbiE
VSEESAAYLFANESESREHTRLRALEAVFDARSQALLLATGALAGRHCLEVGAGAGSIAAWLGDAVGPSGRVVAVDSNTRFLAPLRSRIEVVEGDVRALALPPAAFDLIHARYVLIHNADPATLLAALLPSLKPGGWLVLEEPDFGAAEAMVGPAALRSAVNNVNRAIHATFESRSMDPRFGARLARCLDPRELSLTTLECDPHLARGGSGVADMMRLSTLALSDKYLATRCVSAGDIDAYAEFAADPECWAIYYATFRAVARKRAP